jgi:hypothetical protein
MLAVYEGDDLSGLRPVAGSPYGTLQLQAVAGTIYQIAIDNMEAFYGTAFALEILRPPLNDDFADRLVLSGETVVAASNLGAWREPGEPAEGRDFSLWWSWTAPKTGRLTVTAGTDGIFSLLAFYTGNEVSDLTPVAGVAGTGSFTVEGGTVYHIAASGIWTPDWEISFTLAYLTPNDAFADRASIANNPVTLRGTNTTATSEANESLLEGATGQTLWWTWTAPSNGTVTLDISGSPFAHSIYGALYLGPLLGVYTGDALTNLSLIASNSYYAGGIQPGGISRWRITPSLTFAAIAEQNERTITLLKDYHLFLQDPNPILLRKLKDVLLDCKVKQKTIVLAGCRLVLPPELERELTVVEFALPGREDLRHVLQGILESAGINSMDVEQQDKVIDAASGLTTIEAENAYALSFIQTKSIDPTVVSCEKAQAVKKNGLLEIIETDESLESIGGLDVLKTWLLKRSSAFTERAKQYGLPNPKGLLIIGIPGTGKSLTAKATAKVFGVPLLKLDAGRIFGGIVGQSESNLRSVIQTAEAIAPCCLWIDEMEKGFAGSKSSNATDGGTSARVFGSFISWMQEKKAPVFVVATANDVQQLPPELLRKGRWDELFFVDLPSQEERQTIWSIQIEKHGRDPKDFDVLQLARATDGYTGSEIEAAFVESMFAAFEREQEPTDLTISQVLTDFVPLFWQSLASVTSSPRRTPNCEQTWNYYCVS